MGFGVGEGFCVGGGFGVGVGLSVGVGFGPEVGGGCVGGGSVAGGSVEVEPAGTVGCTVAGGGSVGVAGCVAGVEIPARVGAGTVKVGHCHQLVGCGLDVGSEVVTPAEVAPVSGTGAAVPVAEGGAWNTATGQLAPS